MVAGRSSDLSNRNDDCCNRAQLVAAVTGNVSMMSVAVAADSVVV